MYAAEFEKTKNSQAIRDRLQSAFDEITPLDLPDPCLPSCCDEDAWLIEPAEIDYGWIAAMVASVEERYMGNTASTN